MLGTQLAHRAVAAPCAVSGAILGQLAWESDRPCTSHLAEEDTAMLRSLGPVLGLVAMAIFVSGIFAEAQDVNVKLGPLNSSNESGTATLSDVGGNKTKVVIAVTGQPANTPQPVHVHKG